MGRIVNKEFKWKHDNCCNKGMEILTPHPKKRNEFERKLDRYNHIMELMRTIFAFITVTLQLLILYKLFK